MGLVGRQDSRRINRRKASVAVSKPAPLSSAPLESTIFVRWRLRRHIRTNFRDSTRSSILTITHACCIRRGWQNYCIGGFHRQSVW